MAAETKHSDPLQKTLEIKAGTGYTGKARYAR